MKEIENKRYKIFFEDIKKNDVNFCKLVTKIIDKKNNKNIINELTFNEKKSILSSKKLLSHKNQHYIPQYFINKWKNNNQIKAISLEKGKEVNVSSKKLFSEDNIYYIDLLKYGVIYLEEGLINELELIPNKLNKYLNCNTQAEKKYGIQSNKLSGFEKDLILFVSYCLYFNPNNMKDLIFKNFIDKVIENNNKSEKYDFNLVSVLKDSNKNKIFNWIIELTLEIFKKIFHNDLCFYYCDRINIGLSNSWIEPLITTEERPIGFVFPLDNNRFFLLFGDSIKERLLLDDIPVKYCQSAMISYLSSSDNNGNSNYLILNANSNMEANDLMNTKFFKKNKSYIDLLKDENNQFLN